MVTLNAVPAVCVPGFETAKDDGLAGLTRKLADVPVNELCVTVSVVVCAS